VHPEPTPILPLKSWQPSLLQRPSTSGIYRAASRLYGLGRRGVFDLRRSTGTAELALLVWDLSVCLVARAADWGVYLGARFETQAGISYLLIGQSTNWAQVLTGLAIARMGLGILMPNMTVWLSTAVPESARGRALGGLSTAMFLEQFLSPIISQPFAKPLGLADVYALTGGVSTTIALGFALFKSHVRNLTRSRTT
jgi:MFS family permease